MPTFYQLKQAAIVLGFRCQQGRWFHPDRGFGTYWSNERLVSNHSIPANEQVGLQLLLIEYWKHKPSDSMYEILTSVGVDPE